MFHREHQPSHFHVKYGEHKATFSVDDLQMLDGHLPKRVISLVLEWAFLHRDELRREWELVKNGKPLFKIEPLD